jgi:hypothetical protein
MMGEIMEATPDRPLHRRAMLGKLLAVSMLPLAVEACGNKAPNVAAPGTPAPTGSVLPRPATPEVLFAASRKAIGGSSRARRCIRIRPWSFGSS